MKNDKFRLVAYEWRKRGRLRRLGRILGIVVALAGLSSQLTAESTHPEPQGQGDDELDAGGISIPAAGDVDRLGSRVPGAVHLPPGTAEHIYQDLIDKLGRSYATSGDGTAEHYQNWRRANTEPYHSYSHGRRHLNNYVNDAGLDYLKYEAAGQLPTGSVIAVDSFAVESEGKVLPGPLFVMEKMPAGFNYVSADWRYTLIEPDGTVVGQTNGKNAAAVDRCLRCHLAAGKSDQLFFIPKIFRGH